MTVLIWLLLAPLALLRVVIEPVAEGLVRATDALHDKLAERSAL
jgi:hypothetical protein